MASTEQAESPLHESSNLQLRALVKFTIWFVIVLVVVHLLIWWVFVMFRSAAAQERQVTGVADARMVPPEPRLQPSIDHKRLPAQDMAALGVPPKEAELKRRGLIDDKGNPQITDELVSKIAAQAK